MEEYSWLRYHFLQWQMSSGPKGPFCIHLCSPYNHWYFPWSNPNHCPSVIGDLFAHKWATTKCPCSAAFSCVQFYGASFKRSVVLLWHFCLDNKIVCWSFLRLKSKWERLHATSLSSSPDFKLSLMEISNVGAIHWQQLFPNLILSIQESSLVRHQIYSSLSNGRVFKYPLVYDN